MYLIIRKTTMCWTILLNEKSHKKRLVFIIFFLTSAIAFLLNYKLTLTRELHIFCSNKNYEILTSLEPRFSLRDDIII